MCYIGKKRQCNENIINRLSRGGGGGGNCPDCPFSVGVIAGD